MLCKPKAVSYCVFEVLRRVELVWRDWATCVPSQVAGRAFGGGASDPQGGARVGEVEGGLEGRGGADGVAVVRDVALWALNVQ